MEYTLYEFILDTFCVGRGLSEVDLYWRQSYMRREAVIQVPALPLQWVA